MKNVAIIIGLILLVGGGWYLYQNNMTNTDAEDGASNTTTFSNDGADTDGEMTDDTDATLDADVSVDVATDTKVFDLTGENYAFSETEIRVQEGDTVTIHFSSTQGFHDWVVDEFDAATAQVNTGDSTSVTFVANAAGTYEYYCSVGNHRAQGMVGTLIVE